MQTADSEDENEEELTPEEATEELSLITFNRFESSTYEFVEKSLKRGGDPNVIDDRGRTCLHRLCFDFRNCKETSPFSRKTPANETLKNGLALLRLFLWQDSINVNLLDDHGRGIIHVMTTKMESSRFLETFITIMHMRLVVRHRHSLYQNSDGRDSYDEPATGEILMFPKTMAEVVNLKIGECEFGTSRTGTALLQLCKSDDHDNNRGVISSDTVTRVKILANLGKADPNIGDGYGRDKIFGGDGFTPLFEIMRNHIIRKSPKHQYQIVEILLKAGIENINHLHFGESTYLHWAITNGCPGGVVRLLLEYGADSYILTNWKNDKVPDELKRDALQLAEYHKQSHLVQILKEWRYRRLAINRHLNTMLQGNRDVAARIIRKLHPNSSSSV